MVFSCSFFSIHFISNQSNEAIDIGDHGTMSKFRLIINLTDSSGLLRQCNEWNDKIRSTTFQSTLRFRFPKEINKLLNIMTGNTIERNNGKFGSLGTIVLI